MDDYESGSYIRVCDIEKYYGNASNVTKAIDRVSFQVEKGEFVGVMGASGSGKTTLMNMLSGVIAAVSQFTASLFGTTAKKAQKNAAALYQQAHAVKSVGGAAKEAAKEAETAVAAFDEFNILSFPEQSGGGGGGGVGDIAMPDFDYDYGEPEFDSWGEAFSAFLDKLLAGIPKLEDAYISQRGITLLLVVANDIDAAKDVAKKSVE